MGQAALYAAFACVDELSCTSSSSKCKYKAAPHNRPRQHTKLPAAPHTSLLVQTDVNSVNSATQSYSTASPDVTLKLIHIFASSDKPAESRQRCPCYAIADMAFHIAISKSRYVSVSKHQCRLTETATCWQYLRLVATAGSNMIETWH